MSRFIPRKASFGGVFMHVTNISSHQISHEIIEQGNEEEIVARVGRVQLEQITLSAFIKGPYALTDLASLKKMVKNGEKQLFNLPGVVVDTNYVIKDLNIAHPALRQDFYSFTIQLSEGETKTTNNKASFLDRINNATRALNDAVLEMNAAMDEAFISINRFIEASPIHTAQHISGNLNHSFSIVQNFSELFDDVVTYDIGNLKSNAELLQSRIRKMVTPKENFSADMMASAGVGFTQQKEENEQKKDRASSESEQQLTQQLQDYTQAVFVQQIIALILTGKWRGDATAKEELRLMLTKLLYQLENNFSQHDDGGQKMPSILNNLSNRLNVFLRVTSLGDYHTVILDESMPLILFAWQNYQDEWHKASETMKNLNLFKQAGIMEAGKEFLIPLENYVAGNNG